MNTFEECAASGNSCNRTFSSLLHNTAKESLFFSEGDICRLRNSITEILEDLKLRKELEADNEARINQLILEKHELDRNLAIETKKMTCLEEDHQSELTHVRQQCEERLKCLEEEHKKFNILKKCAEEEMKSLKEEARSQQLSKYKFEKQLREVEAKLSISEKLSADQTEQLRMLERKISSMKGHFQLLEGSQKRVNKNVDEASSLNGTLMRVNNHRRCVIRQLQEENDSLKKELVTARAEAECLKIPFELCNQELQQDCHRLRVRNRTLEEKTESLTKQNKSCQEMLFKTTGCLRETQDLLRGQQATAFTKEQEAQIVQDRLTSLEQECAVLVAQRDELVNDLDQHRQQSLTDKESWENEVTEMERQKNHAESKLVDGENRVVSLQENKVFLTARLDDAIAQLTEAHSQIHVSRSSQQSQADVSSLDKSSRSSQTDFNHSSKYVQAMPTTSTVSSQLALLSHHQAMQTDKQLMSSVACQSAAVTSEGEHVQTGQVKEREPTDGSEKTIDEWCTQRDANLHLTTVASMPTSLRQPTDGRLPREEKKVDTADVNSGSGDVRNKSHRIEGKYPKLQLTRSDCFSIKESPTHPPPVSVKEKTLSVARMTLPTSLPLTVTVTQAPSTGADGLIFSDDEVDNYDKFKVSSKAGEVEIPAYCESVLEMLQLTQNDDKVISTLTDDNDRNRKRKMTELQ